jgi:GNAT superfamily N-acetyltransferase
VDNADIDRLAHLNYLSFSRESSLWSNDGAVHEGDGVLLLAAPIDFPFVINAAHRTDPKADPAEVIGRADEFFDRWSRGYTLVTGPWDQDLAEHARSAGLDPFGATPEMVCRQRLPEVDLADGVELRWADDESTMADAVAVNAEAYPTLGLPAEAVPRMMERLDLMLEPHLGTVVAYEGDTALATAQAMLSHGIAGVFWVGTVEAARGRGLGEAVCRAVTNWAFDRGAAFQSLEASPMGEPIYARMGYEERYRLTEWYRKPAAER